MSDQHQHRMNRRYSFALARGARSKVTRSAGAGGFAGQWTFNPPSAATGVNIETLVDSGGQESRQPVSGQLVITRTGPGKIVVRTANGCRWKLNVAGNTAELAGQQTCHLRAGAAQTYRFWAMAVGGGRQYAVLSGAKLSPGKRTEFSLATARLTKSA